MQKSLFFGKHLAYKVWWEIERTCNVGITLLLLGNFHVFAKLYTTRLLYLLWMSQFLFKTMEIGFDFLSLICRPRICQYFLFVISREVEDLLSFTPKTYHILSVNGSRKPKIQGKLTFHASPLCHLPKVVSYRRKTGWLRVSNKVVSRTVHQLGLSVKMFA